MDEDFLNEMPSETLEEDQILLNRISHGDEYFSNFSFVNQDNILDSVTTTNASSILSQDQSKPQKSVQPDTDSQSGSYA